MIAGWIFVSALELRRRGDGFAGSGPELRSRHGLHRQILRQGSVRQNRRRLVLKRLAILCEPIIRSVALASSGLHGAIN